VDQFCNFRLVMFKLKADGFRVRCGRAAAGGADMKSIHGSILTRALMTGAASLALLMIGAAEGRAESVFVQGANGANFIYGNPDVPATDGESVTATAGSTDPYNSAYAIGGNGGQGVSDLVGQSGGWGGSASATATTVISGSAEAVATAVGGAFVGGGYGLAGEAYAVANAAAGGGNAVATAMATGGPCIGACQSSNNGYATSNAETVNGAMADAQSGASSTAEGQASSSAKTIFAGVSTRLSALATNFGTFFGPATTNAIAQGGSGQAFVNPGQTAYAFSTALPDKAYATTLIDGASHVADALLGPRDAVFGTAILGANYAANAPGGVSVTSTFDFIYGGDLQLGLIGSQLTGFSSGAGFESMEFTIAADGEEIFDRTFTSLAIAESFFRDDVIDLGSNLGPDIDLTFGYTLIADGSGGFGFDFAVGGLGAAPEPSTWAMMLVGFAGIGFMGWRRRAAWAV
jgi:hypothetical protein